ncbi:MAG: hypothetical protein ACR2K2_06360 [Mycobacteriales bacterium]
MTIGSSPRPPPGLATGVTIEVPGPGTQALKRGTDLRADGLVVAQAAAFSVQD